MNKVLIILFAATLGGCGAGHELVTNTSSILDAIIDTGVGVINTTTEGVTRTSDVVTGEE